jgi:hypothetical protein
LQGTVQLVDVSYLLPLLLNEVPHQICLNVVF